MPTQLKIGGSVPPSSTQAYPIFISVSTVDRSLRRKVLTGRSSDRTEAAKEGIPAL